MRAATLSALVAVASLALSACGSTPMREPMPMPVVAAPAPANGSIYQAGRNIALFEDAKARQVGDVLTVELVEKTDASKSASTNTSKDSSVGITPPTIAGRPVTVGGTEILDFSLGSENGFTGSGGSSQSNTLTGTLSVIVTQVLPNGNLVVRGEKRIALNQGWETVSVEGIVRPQDIEKDNSISSERIANATIRYGGKGVIDDANEMGWFARLFNSAFFPF